MPQSVVVYVDISGIQGYIFGSNRLRENIGASYLVKVASSIPNLAKKQAGWIKPDNGSVIFAGGGKACLIFPSQQAAKDWTRAYTLCVLRDAPGLRCAVGHSEPFAYAAAGTDLTKYINAAQKDARRVASMYAPFAPTLGLGVTVPCRSTGLVAVGQRRKIDGVPDEEGANDYPVSREIQAKTQAASRTESGTNDAAMKDLLSLLPALEEVTKKYSIARDFDDFGRKTGDYSYLAVVHADGNGIGNLFTTLHTAKLPDLDYQKAYGALSELVNVLGAKAMDETIKHAAFIMPNGAFKDIVEHLNRDPETDQPFFPLRPLVYGGDDITFVCDARLALTLTPYLLEQFELQSATLLSAFKSAYSLPNFPDKLTACAGITIFKTHYPFARAYAMCEELCQSAKQFSQQVANKTVSALDWQVAPSGRVDDLEALREHEYHISKTESLTLRPVLLDSDQTWRTWSNVQKALEGFGNDWRERRNKLIAFQDVNRQGEQATRNWQKNLNNPLVLQKFGATRVDDGATWVDDDAPIPDQPIRQISLYFDVIELLEHYRALEEAQEQIG